MEVQEQKIANEIVNLGLKKAAESMAFFTKESVEIKASEVREENLSKIDRIIDRSSSDIHYVLTTEIKGELQGICYLIFTEEEVERILGVALPESVLNDPQKLRVMGDAILLEMDNIIVASVVTQFSNSFNYKMYGDVPRLGKSNTQDLKALMHKENEGRDQFIYFKSEMHTKSLDISPEFVWMLDDNFLKGVQKVSKAS
jgi:chemotaxis protein CheY-P-specific phosphatase CheC